MTVVEEPNDASFFIRRTGPARVGTKHVIKCCRAGRAFSSLNFFEYNNSENKSKIYTLNWAI